MYLFVVKQASFEYPCSIQKMTILVFGLTRSGLELMSIYHTRGEHDSHYTTDVVNFIGEFLDFACLKIFHKRTSSPSHLKLTCSRHDIAENCYVDVKQQSLTPIKRRMVSKPKRIVHVH
jgi:hypothetical protein